MFQQSLLYSFNVNLLVVINCDTNRQAADKPARLCPLEPFSQRSCFTTRFKTCKKNTPNSIVVTPHPLIAGFRGSGLFVLFRVCFFKSILIVNWPFLSSKSLKNIFKSLAAILHIVTKSKWVKVFLFKSIT